MREPGDCPLNPTPVNNALAMRDGAETRVWMCYERSSARSADVGVSRFKDSHS
jgi:hypothetical protein